MPEQPFDLELGKQKLKSIFSKSIITLNHKTAQDIEAGDYYGSTFLESRQGLIKAFNEAFELGVKEDERWFMVGSTAVLPLIGVMVPDAGYWGKYFGLTSTNEFISDVKTLTNDSKVKNVLFYVDSPGGAVDRIAEAHEAVKALADAKKTSAFAMHMNSAAYWTICPVDTITISSTGSAGSISAIYGPIVDSSKADEDAGFKSHYIRGFAKKALGQRGESIDETVLESYQKDVEEVTSVFVSAVSATRSGLTPQVIASLEGESFIGRRALENNLVDAVGSFDLVLASIPVGETIMSKETKGGDMDLSQVTVEQLRANAPELVKAIETAAITPFKQQVAALEIEVGALKEESNKVKRRERQAEVGKLVTEAMASAKIPDYAYGKDEAGRQAFAMSLIETVMAAESNEVGMTAVKEEIASRVALYEAIRKEHSVSATPPADAGSSEEIADALAANANGVDAIETPKQVHYNDTFISSIFS